jgi:hypothetical protein
LPETDIVEEEDEYSPQLFSEPDIPLLTKLNEDNGTHMIVACDQHMNTEKEERPSRKEPKQKENKIDSYLSSNPSERRHWELCEKPRTSPGPSLAWNYFLVYKDHQEFPAAVCKKCYNEKKDSSSSSPVDWECCIACSAKPKKLVQHLRNDHLELFQQLTEAQEEINNDTEVRRTWEICEQLLGREDKNPIWNYLCVYKHHPEFRAAICKKCYNAKKDTKASPKCWETLCGSRGPNPLALANHLQRIHPQEFEEYKRKFTIQK